ncbi:hypothetical protein [Paenibacillus validus]|uniref:hypothetical protein n=1 Tax=Paenibacillus validus TaxID=44253 RepID=UPI003D2E3664
MAADRVDDLFFVVQLLHLVLPVGDEEEIADYETHRAEYGSYPVCDHLLCFVFHCLISYGKMALGLLEVKIIQIIDAADWQLFLFSCKGPATRA